MFAYVRKREAQNTATTGSRVCGPDHLDMHVTSIGGEVVVWHAFSLDHLYLHGLRNASLRHLHLCVVATMQPV